MESFISLLNQNSGALTVIFTGVVTLATVVYATLTAVLVIETKRLRQAQTEPRIEVTVDSLDFAVNIVRLCVRNIGEGPARNVKFENSVIEGGSAGESLLQEFTTPQFFKTGLRYFGPGQFRYSGYTRTTKDLEGKVSSVLSFKVAYESATGKRYIEELVVDMAEMRGRYQLGTPNMYAIAKSLEKVQKDLHLLVGGTKRLEVNSYDEQDREKEKQQREERMASLVNELNEFEKKIKS